MSGLGGLELKIPPKNLLTYRLTVRLSVEPDSIKSVRAAGFMVSVKTGVRPTSVTLRWVTIKEGGWSMVEVVTFKGHSVH
jgi:hypothetical protein